MNTRGATSILEVILHIFRTYNTSNLRQVVDRVGHDSKMDWYKQEGFLRCVLGTAKESRGELGRIILQLTLISGTCLHTVPSAELFAGCISRTLVHHRPQAPYFF